MAVVAQVHAYDLKAGPHAIADCTPVVERAEKSVQNDQRRTIAYGLKVKAHAGEIKVSREAYRNGVKRKTPRSKAGNRRDGSA